MEWTLRSGERIPAMGFGTYQTQDTALLREAVRAGFRYFDTASFYGTEEVLGEALSGSGLGREEYLVATKLWKTEMGAERAREALENSLRRLGLEYVDFYLIHWPKPAPDAAGWEELDLETWAAMADLQREGKVRHIGVSNFLPHHLENLVKSGAPVPEVDQIEFHPGYLQRETLDYCRARGILPQAWSPLGRRRMLEHPAVAALAEKYGASPAQICLGFAMEMGVMPLPKASSYERMRENLAAQELVLSPEDVENLAAMEQAGWSGEHPDRPRVRT